MEKRKIISILLFVAILYASLWAEEDKSIFKNLSAQDFTEKIRSMKDSDEYMIIDVRTPEEYNSKRIKNALNMNFYDSSFLSSLEELDRSKKYFIYCLSGNRSGQTLMMMESLGFREVYNLGRGIFRDTQYLDTVKQ